MHYKLIQMIVECYIRFNCMLITVLWASMIDDETFQALKQQRLLSRCEPTDSQGFHVNPHCQSAVIVH